MNFWNQIFKSASKGSKLSPEQCRASQTILGSAPAQCATDYPMLDKNVLEICKAITNMFGNKEQKKTELLMSRMSKTLYGPNWPAGAETTRETSKEPATQNDDIVSAMHQFTKKVHEVQGKKNYYTRHDLKYHTKI